MPNAGSPTPLSPLPFEGFTLTVGAGAIVELNPAPYSNTKEVIISNLSPTGVILTQVAVVYPALPGVVTAANSTQVPASAAVSLCIGSEGCRNPLGTQAYWNTAPAGFGSLLNIVLANPGGVDIDVNVTYIQNAGAGGKVGGC